MTRQCQELEGKKVKSYNIPTQIPAFKIKYSLNKPSQAKYKVKTLECKRRERSVLFGTYVSRQLWFPRAGKCRSCQTTTHHLKIINRVGP